jgi:hypothetical protein
LSTDQQNHASERLRSAIKSAIDGLFRSHPDRVLELSEGLDKFARSYSERELADFVAEELCDAVDMQKRAKPVEKPSFDSERNRPDLAETIKNTVKMFRTN